ncbi:transposase [Deinococcus saxicola]
MLRLIQLLDDEKCIEVVRQLRWPDGVMCPHCQEKNGFRLFHV